MNHPNFIHFSSLDHPLLEPYRNQKDAWLRAAHNPASSAGATPTGMPSGLFMAEGELVVEQLLGSNYPVVSLLVSRNRVDSLASHFSRVRPETPVLVGEPAVLESIVGYAMHRGVLACGQRSVEPTLADILEFCTTLVVLEDLANHDNVGGIARCLRALGGPAPAMLLTPGCCDPLYRRALRVSIGHALHIPFTTLNWPEDLDTIRRAGFRVLALSPSPAATPIDRVERSARVCLIAGTEGPGLSKRATRGADELVSIPMQPAVDSLNVMVSVAVALHALGRNDPDLSGVDHAGAVRIPGVESGPSPA